MTRLGLLVTSDHFSVAVTEGSRIQRRISGELTDRDLVDIGTIIDRCDSDVRRLGNKLTSVFVVTDSVAKSLMHVKGLNNVALFRLSLPEATESPPLVERELARKKLKVFCLNGGHGYDGRITTELKEEELKNAFQESNAEAFVISSPFANLFPDHETKARDILGKLGAKNVWTSSEVSSMPSLLDRETTAVLCAAAQNVVGKIATDLHSKFSNYRMNPSIYFAKNDGNAIGWKLAQHYPLDTAWSVQGHSATGVARLGRLPNSIAVGISNGRIWICGTKNSSPIMQNITFLKDMLLHVASPMIADFPRKAQDEIKQSYFDLFSAMTGQRRAFLTSANSDLDVPFKTEKTESLFDVAAVNATYSRITWGERSSVPKGHELSPVEKSLRKRLDNELTMAGAKRNSIRFGKLEMRPGSNMPEGTSTISISAVGNPN